MIIDWFLDSCAPWLLQYWEAVFFYVAACVLLMQFILTQAQLRSSTQVYDIDAEILVVALQILSPIVAPLWLVFKIIVTFAEAGYNIFLNVCESRFIARFVEKCRDVANAPLPAAFERPYASTDWP